MAEKAKGKRPFLDDDSGVSPVQKKPRFPKGKKVKREDGEEFGGGNGDDEVLEGLVDPRHAARERAKRRSKLREEELFREQADVFSAEVHYEDNANLEDDGIQIEPFNLKQEREEGYFDANGNYVEYAIRNEIKDAWLDNVVVDSSFAEKVHQKPVIDEDYQDLSTEELGKIKRRIANILEPGETIIQALKRLKGTSGDKKGKMSEGIKRMFDQLTEDAMKLMENGEYNVYHDERETFEREAEGYERIARARQGASGTADNSSFGTKLREDSFPYGMGSAADDSSLADRALDHTKANTTVQASSIDGDDQFDMFGEDDDTNVNPQSNGSTEVCGSVSEQIAQPTSENMDSSQPFYSEEASSGVESDYVYDQSSGYYYSSSLGYYYDPASRLYCCATSGKWYSFDESTGEYVELQNATPAVDAAEN